MSNVHARPGPRLDQTEKERLAGFQNVRPYPREVPAGEERIRDEETVQPAGTGKPQGELDEQRIEAQLVLGAECEETAQVCRLLFFRARAVSQPIGNPRWIADHDVEAGALIVEDRGEPLGPSEGRPLWRRREEKGVPLVDLRTQEPRESGTELLLEPPHHDRWIRLLRSAQSADRLQRQIERRQRRGPRIDVDPVHRVGRSR